MMRKARRNKKGPFFGPFRMLENFIDLPEELNPP